MKVIASIANMKLHAETSGVFAWSPVTGEEYSADARDYFYLDESKVLKDTNGHEMLLAVRGGIHLLETGGEG